MEQPIYRRPEPGTFPEFYARYIAQVPDGDIVRLLRLSAFDALVLLESLPAEKWDFRYAEDKWSIKEVLLHIIDTERIMAYRALRFARLDPTPLPGFDQDAYVPASGAQHRSPESLMAEFKAVREATVQLFENLPDAYWDHVGTANRYSFTVRAMAYIITGHELHHRQILRERYLEQ